MRQEPGVRRGDPAFVMSRSELMLFNSCPSRWLAGYVPKDTDATDWGGLLDCLLTDHDRFDERYAVQPETVTATKSMTCVKDGDAKEGDPVPWRECAEAKEWKAQQRGRTIISHQEHLDALSAVKRLTDDRELRELLACSAKQVMVVAEYVDKETGVVVPVKVLLDLVPAVDSRFGKDLADLKTCRSAAPTVWEKAVDERNYDAQAAINTDVYVAATGEDRNTFLHVLLENVFPYQPGRRMLSSELVNLGRMKITSALRNYCRCLASGKWPSWEEASNRSLNGWLIVEASPYHSQIKYPDPLWISG